MKSSSRAEEKAGGTARGARPGHLAADQAAVGKRRAAVMSVDFADREAPLPAVRRRLAAVRAREIAGYAPPMCGHKPLLHVIARAQPRPRAGRGRTSRDDHFFLREKRRQTREGETNARSAPTCVGKGWRAAAHALNAVSARATWRRRRSLNVADRLRSHRGRVDSRRSIVES